MKKSIQILTYSTLVLIFSSCGAIIKEHLEPTFELIEDLSEIQGDLEDAMSLSEDAVNITLENGSVQYLIGDCGIATNDTSKNILSIDFGENDCQGFNEQQRKGKIEIKYLDRTDPNDYQYSIEFQNYRINDNRISGKLSVNTIHRNQSGQLELSEIVEDGKIILKNGNTYTWTSERTRTWVLGEETASIHDDVFTIDGYSKGGNALGTTFSYKIIKPLTYSRSCWKQGIIYPIAGQTTVVMSGQPNRIIDWGLLICNKVVNITQNGKLFILELK